MSMQSSTENIHHSIQHERIVAKVRLESVVEQMIQRILLTQDPTIDFLHTNGYGIQNGNDNDGSVTNTSNNGINFTLLSRDQQGAYVGAKDLASLLRVMQSSHQMLCRERTITQRELYYLHAHYFKNQQETIVSLNKLQNLVMIPRYNLGILAASKGWICGLIKINESNNSNADNYVSLDSGITRPIPSDVVYNPLKFQNDGAEFILVVEKECIFRRLVEDKVWENGITNVNALSSSSSSTIIAVKKSLPCIIVTGCGFPDFATRAIVSQLHQQLRLPVYGLSDYNPYGLGIMLCYMHNRTSKVTKASSKKSNRGVEQSHRLSSSSSSSTKRTRFHDRFHLRTEEDLNERYDMDDLEDIHEVDGDDDEAEYIRNQRYSSFANEADAWDDDLYSSGSNHQGRIPIEWIGLRWKDIEHYKLNRSILQGFTYMDERKTLSLIKDSFLLSLPASEEYLGECNVWLNQRCKMEIEGLLSRGLDFLQEYLWDKIYGNRYTAVEEDSTGEEGYTVNDDIYSENGEDDWDDI